MPIDFEPYIDEEGDVLGSFTEEEVVYMDKGSTGEQIVTILAFHNGRCVIEDNQGQRFNVSIFRLTKP